MSTEQRPGGEGKTWVDPERAAPQNAFDKDDEHSGQQYSREAEAAQGRADRAHDTPHERTQPDTPVPADPEDFSAPRTSGSG
jgi:hypothetical protein